MENNVEEVKDIEQFIGGNKIIVMENNE